MTTALPTEPQVFRALVADIADFIRANAWRIETDSVNGFEHLADSIVFHLVRGTMTTTRNADGELTGVAIAWRENEASLRQHSEADVFHWQETDPAGDALYWALVLTSAPGLMPQLTQQMLDIHPEWANLKFMAHRRGRLVRRDGLIQRVLATKRA